MCVQNFRLRGLLCLALVIASSSFASADTLDQSNGPGAFDFQFNRFLDVGQTFTVGLDGQLTNVNLFVSRNAATSDDLLVDIRTVSGGLPTDSNAGANVLGTATISAGDVSSSGGAWESIDFTADNINVTAGDELAIVLRTTSTSSYSWLATGDASNPTDFYAGGIGAQRVPPAGGWGAPFSDPLDFSFQTFVVPEPSGVAFGLAALMGLLGSRRRRNS